MRGLRLNFESTLNQLWINFESTLTAISDYLHVGNLWGASGSCSLRSQIEFCKIFAYCVLSQGMA